MISTLLLVERDDQVRDFIGRGLDKEAQWIALDVSAAAYLDQLGLSYAHPAEFYESKDLESICLQSHRDVATLCQTLDGKLLQDDPSLASSGLRPFEFNIVPLTMMMDALRGRIFQLKQILKAFPSQRICIHRTASTEWGYYGIGFSADESVWAQLLALPGWNRQIEFCDQTPAQPSTQPWLRYLYQVTAHSLEMTALLRAMKLRNVRLLWDVLRWRNNKTVLMMGGGGDWLSTQTLIHDAGWGIVFVNEDFFAPREPSVGPPVPRLGSGYLETTAATYTHEDGISFYPILQDRFHWIANTFPTLAQVAHKTFADLKQRFDVQVLLRSESPTGLGHAVEIAARNQGCPVFHWQHGLVTHHQEITQLMDYSQTMCADATLVYGDAVNQTLKQCGKRFQSQIHTVGSAALDTLAHRPPEDHRPSIGRPIRLLYATTSYVKEEWYLGFPPAWSNILYYRDQKILLESVTRLANEDRVNAIVKLHPSMTPHEAGRLLGMTPKGIRLMRRERSFTSLLPQSDVVVLDCPSTTLLQAVRAGLPVFVLMRHWRYPSEARELLERRAVCADTAEDLADRLTRFVQSGVYTADVTDDLFIKAYGTHLNDGQSARRAIDHVFHSVAP